MQTKFKLVIALASIATIVSGTAAESGQGQNLPPLPQKLVTTDGKTYDYVKLLRTDPDGVVIEYALAGRGVGMAKIRFRNLPESLQQQYGFDADRAKTFEADQAQALAQWRAQRLEQENAARQAARPEAQANEATQPATGPAMLDSGRFEVAPTIAGAVVLDKQTGEAWLVDLHSTITPQDLTPFLQRKDTAP
jgi:hypothetical protein